MFQRVLIDYNREYASNYSLIISNQNTTINLEVVVTKDVILPVWNTILIEMRPSKESAYSKIMSFDVNFCDLLKNAKIPGFSLLTVWFNNVLKYGVLPNECPIKKVCVICPFKINRNGFIFVLLFQGVYYWRNFKLDKNSIPQFILKGLYRLSVMVYQKSNSRNEMLMNSTLYFIVKFK